MAAVKRLNVIITTFEGLPSPIVLNRVPSDTTIDQLFDHVAKRLPQSEAINWHDLALSTVGRTPLYQQSQDPVRTLLPSEDDDWINLSLWARARGGKGGFGSQLRAAGGRMSSKRKKNQGESNGSSRNLDGRRLRTVTEAKALAEYLAVKPDMEKREKEKRKERWQQIVDMAEQKEHDIRSGSKAKLDGKWVEDKEEAHERTREAVLAAMKTGRYKDNLLAPPQGSTEAESDISSEDEDQTESSGSSHPVTPPVETTETKAKPRTYFGFDEDDEFMSSSDEEGRDEGSKS